MKSGNILEIVQGFLRHHLICILLIGWPWFSEFGRLRKVKRYVEVWKGLVWHHLICLFSLDCWPWYSDFFFGKSNYTLKFVKAPPYLYSLQHCQGFSGESARMKIEEKGKHNALVTIKFNTQRKLLQKIWFWIVKSFEINWFYAQQDRIHPMIMFSF